MKRWDVIVVGVGGMGAATCWRLALAGARVLGIEQHPLGHALGSSHGQSRLIRMAYFEHPDYVPLLRRAYTLWDELGAAQGQSVLHRTGLVLIGPPNSEEIAGARRSAVLHGLPLSDVTAELPSRFPGFRLPDGAVAVFEPDGGWLPVEECVTMQIAQARRHGAEIHSGERVRGYQVEGDSVVVETDRARYGAGRLVLAQGAWSGPLLAELGGRLSVHRNVLLWLESESAALHQGPSAPCFGFALPSGFFYGFPDVDHSGTIKVAHHVPGEGTKPDAVDRSLRPADTDAVVAFAKQHLPGVRPVVRRHAVCLYEMSPDGHFVIGLHPRWPQIVLLAGFSGHGFKFAPVVGEIAAELSLRGETQHPVELFAPSRFFEASRPALAQRQDG